MEEESWTTGHFDATLLTGPLRVGLVPSGALCECLHALVKLLVLDAEEAGESFFPAREEDALSPPDRGLGAHGLVEGIDGQSQLLDFDGLGEAAAEGQQASGVNVMLVQDLDGVTVIVNERYFGHLQRAGVVGKMRWAPSPWRALQIHLGPASADAPGIISYLSSMLSERNVSILNFSTFEADLILVQDFDLKKARELLVECGRHGVCGLKEQIAEKRQGNLRGAVAGDQAADGTGAAGRGKPRSNSVSSLSIVGAGLAVVKTPLVLTSIKRAMLRQTMFSLMKQLTRNVDVQVQTEKARKSASEPLAQMRDLQNDYLWAYFSTNDEISLLLDERDLKDFPEDSLVVCPQRWKAIRLVGKDIPFDETGIVHIMSSPYEVGVQLLNMSTYATNISLVAEDEVSSAIARLRRELNGDETQVLT